MSILSELSEREKVGALFRLLEDSLKGELYLHKENQTLKVGRVYPVRKGFGKEEGRPDIVLWIELNTRILGALVKANFPVLVESEEGGIYDAKPDYEVFFDKAQALVPMIVIGGNKKVQGQRIVSARVMLAIKQVPTRLVLANPKAR